MAKHLHYLTDEIESALLLLPEQMNSLLHVTMVNLKRHDFEESVILINDYKKNSPGIPEKMVPVYNN